MASMGINNTSENVKHAAFIDKLFIFACYRSYWFGYDEMWKHLTPLHIIHIIEQNNRLLGYVFRCVEHYYNKSTRKTFII